MKSSCLTCDSSVLSGSGLLSINAFMLRMHSLIKSIQDDFKIFERFQKRFAKGTEAKKIQAEYELFCTGLKSKVFEYMAAFENPYYIKVKLHYPQVVDIFSKFKMTLLSHRILKQIP